jgi:hypothetical protein
MIKEMKIKIKKEFQGLQEKFNSKKKIHKKII